MKKYLLSVIIPANSEMFLARTIQDLLENTGPDTEIIAVLDGKWANPQIPQHDRVNIIYVGKSIGQRAATNLGVKLSRAKYVAKCDAHCSFDKDFDTKMIEGFKKMGDDVMMVPIMRNLWAFDWKCWKCGWKKYQGPTPTICPDCGTSDKIRHQMKWIGKHNPQSKSYCFDSNFHFQYFNAYKKTDKYKKELETGFTETMSLQGSFFMCTRERYWEYEVCDERAGSWGNQGIELSLKTRTLGHKVLVNHSTFYAHMFRTQGGDFSFPYEQRGRTVQKTKKYIRDLFFENKWDKQIYPLSKVIYQFEPIPGWKDDAIQNLRENEMKVERPGIYSIKNKVNKKIYIGSAINLARRFGEHLRMLHRKDHENKYLQSAWNKYGEKNFTFNIEYFCKKEDLIKHEQKFIDEYKSKIGWRKMYNLNPIAGSNLGRKHTSESLAKMSLQQSGKGNGFYDKKHTEESINKMKEAHKGNIPWNKGIPRSDKTKEKIGKANMGNSGWNKGLTKETDIRVQKYANKLIGKKKVYKNGYPKGMLGKHHSEEAKQKMSLAQKINPHPKDKKTGRFIGKIAINKDLCYNM